MEKLLSCPLCNEPFQHAIELLCCPKCYCLRCIERKLEQAKPSSEAKCPSCQTPFTYGQWKDNKPLQTLVDDLPAQCPNQALGCQTTLKRGTVDQHLLICDYTTVECPNRSCPRKLSRVDLPKHVKVCEYAMTTCPHGCTIPVSELSSHEQSCTLLPQTYDVCHQSAPRTDFSLHQSLCSSNFECPFASVGCSTPVTPKGLDTHFHDNLELHFKLSLILLKIREEEIALLKTQLAISATTTVAPQIQNTAQNMQNHSPQSPQEELSSSLNSGIILSSDYIQHATQENLPPLPPSSQSRPPSIISDAPTSNVDQSLREYRINTIHNSPSPVAPPVLGSPPNPSQGVMTTTSSPPPKPQEFGTKLFSILPKATHQLYIGLATSPQLLIECLILNMEFESLRKLFDLSPLIFKQEMFLQYAQKAMQFSTTNYEAQIRIGLDAIKGPTPVPNSKPLILTGNVSYDESIRQQHNFPDVPNTDIALHLLRFCTDKAAAMFTIGLADNFHGFVTGFVQYGYNLNVVESLKTVLRYGKVLLLKNSTELPFRLLEAYDTYLAYLDIMTQIINSKKPIQIQLEDFTDTNKSRAVRDKLIELLEFEIARDLCVRTQLPTEPVSIAWGMHLLKSNKYTEARQVFQQVFPSTPPKTGAVRKTAGFSLSQTRGIDTQLILDNIIQLLDPPPPAPSTPIKSSSSGKLTTLAPPESSKKVFSPSKSTIGNPLTQNLQITFTLDSAKAGPAVDPPLPAQIDQALFYLEKYGSPQSAIKFLMKHNLIEHACAYIVDNQIEPETFVDKVVMPSYAADSLNVLQNALANIDPQKTKTKSYLMAACKYLNEQKAFQHLVRFQVFMKDYVRAALTCIRVFIEALEQHEKIKCLGVAKEYFKAALQELSYQKPPSEKLGAKESSESKHPEALMSISDIQAYITKIDVQLEVIACLQPLYKNRHIPNLEDATLFGPQSQRNLLAWVLLVYKMDVGLRVLTDTIRKDEWPGIFTSAGLHAARTFPLSQAISLVDAVKSAGADTEWQDIILKAECDVFSLETGDTKTSESLAKQISDPKIRCVALMDCGKLKTAYLEAVKIADNQSLMESILSAAQMQQDVSVIKLCSTYLSQRSKAV